MTTGAGVGRRRAWLTALAIAVLFTLSTLSTVSAAAYALIPTGRDCLTPPLPADPTSGVAAMLDPGPQQNVAGDPFKSDQATMYDRYGYAGLRLSVFDVPNRLDFCQPLVIDRDVSLANGAFTAATVFTALAVRLTRLVTDGTFGSLWDPIQQALIRSFGGQLFVVGVGVAGGVAAIYVAWRHARKGQLSAVATWVAKATAIMVIAVGCVGYAVGVGGAIDKGISLAFQSAGEVTSGAVGRTSSDLVGATMVEHVLYPTWQAATFGGDRQAEAEYSERLWKAGTLTREEQAAIAADPAQSAPELDKRRETYKTTMVEMQSKYPQTYRIAAGIDTGGYGWTALAGMLTVGVVTWFLLGCLVIMLWGSLYARVIMGVFPVVAIPAILPKFHRFAFDQAKNLALAVWQAVVSSLAFFAFLIAGVGTVMRNTQLPLFVRAAAVVLLAVGLAKLLAKFKVGAGVPDRLRPRIPGPLGRRLERRAAERRGRARGRVPFVGPDGSDADPSPRKTEAGSGSVPTPPEARMRPRRAVTAQPAPVDLGELQSAEQPKRKGRGATAMRVGAAVAGKSHPVAGAVLTAGSVVQKRRAVASQGGSRRALPAGRQRTGDAPAGAAPAASRRPMPGKPVNPAPSVRPASSTASRAVVRGVVVKGARGYHARPASPRVK